MVLKLFIDISTSFIFSKISMEWTLHSEAPPWPTPQSQFSGTSSYYRFRWHHPLLTELNLKGLLWTDYFAYFTWREEMMGLLKGVITLDHNSRVFFHTDFINSKGIRRICVIQYCVIKDTFQPRFLKNLRKPEKTTNKTFDNRSHRS